VFTRTLGHGQPIRYALTGWMITTEIP